MYTNYHLSSAKEINNDFIIIVEDDEIELSDEMKSILDERIVEDKSDYITAEESINRLQAKYLKFTKKS